MDGWAGRMCMKGREEGREERVLHVYGSVYVYEIHVLRNEWNG